MQNGGAGSGAAPSQAPPALTLADIQAAYARAETTPSQLVQRLYPAWEAAGPAFITLAPLEDLLQRARELEALPAAQRGPLHGVPFGVKDNIDVAGFPTTAACKAFGYSPAASAPVVQQLLAAGGIMVGKTNMDQFAAGLVGTRTPYGVPRNAFDARFVPGGSSSGSGALVGAGLLPFALGTDTAGSGRVPAMFNGCVGVKPTVGRLSTLGVVPAARALDCVTVFSQNVADGAAVARLMEAAGSLEDPTWQPPLAGSKRRHQPGTPFQFGVPAQQFLDFQGPGGAAAAAGYAQLFSEAVERLQGLGGTPVAINFSPFAEVASMLYGTSFVAARYDGIRDFLHAASANDVQTQPGIRTAGSKPSANANGKADGMAALRTMSSDSDDSAVLVGRPSASSAAGDGAPLTLSTDQILADDRMERVTRAIIGSGCGRSAADLYHDMDRLSRLKAQARVQMAGVDLLLVPTALHHYTLAEIEAQEQAPQVTWEYNANLGRFTNFVNLLDMAGIALPSGLLSEVVDGSDPAAEERRRHLGATGGPPTALPFGVTLLGTAWSDEFLWGLAAEYVEKTGLRNGPAGHGVVAAA